MATKNYIVSCKTPSISSDGVSATGWDPAHYKNELVANGATVIKDFDQIHGNFYEFALESYEVATRIIRSCYENGRSCYDNDTLLLRK